MIYLLIFFYVVHFFVLLVCYTKLRLVPKRRISEYFVWHLIIKYYINE